MAEPARQNDRLQQITAYLHDIVETQGPSGADASLEPPTPAQLSDLFQYLSRCPPPANAADASTTRKPTLLHIGSGRGHVAVAAARFDVFAQCIGLDDDERNVKNSIRLAFEQKAFEKCHFFHIDDLAADPRILLDNPHFIGEKLNEADVVLVHASPTTIERLVPLLARMSTKKAERKFVTLTHHIPDEFAVNPQIVEGTELCSYDGVLDNREPAPSTTMPPPPEPVDGEDNDREFARRSIRHALPEHLQGGSS